MTIEDMCRELLGKAIEHDIVLRIKPGCYKTCESNAKSVTDAELDASGMANLLATFLAPNYAKEWTKSPPPMNFDPADIGLFKPESVFAKQHLTYIAAEPEWHQITDNLWRLGPKIRGIIRKPIAEVWFSTEMLDSTNKPSVHGTWKRGWHWQADKERGMTSDSLSSIEACEKALGL